MRFKEDVAGRYYRTQKERMGGVPGLRIDFLANLLRTVVLLESSNAKRNEFLEYNKYKSTRAQEHKSTRAQEHKSTRA